MKKFFPIYLVFVIASVLSVGQLMFNWLDLKAGATKVENKINSHYESIYSDLSFKTADGKKIVLNSVKAPIVVLNFWATWCQPCLSEFPSIVAMKKKYNDQQVMVFGINQDDEFQMANIKKATKKYHLLSEDLYVTILASTRNPIRTLQELHRYELTHSFTP